ncbi:MAG: S24 family peptidase, partial [Dongiaceae bacterium]
DDRGHPAGKSWSESDPPGVSDPDAFALKITGNTLAPVYRAGDVVVVSPDAEIRRGDRVIVKTRNGEILAKELIRQSAQKVELKAIGSGPSRTLAKNDVLWMARVQWVRQ